MSHGNIFEKLKQLPSSTVTAAQDNNVLSPRHLGTIAALTANVEIPSYTFKAGDLIGLRNTTAGTVTISAGPDITLKLEGSALTGTRTLAAYGQASLWFETAAVAWLIGGSVS